MRCQSETCPLLTPFMWMILSSDFQGSQCFRSSTAVLSTSACFLPSRKLCRRNDTFCYLLKVVLLYCSRIIIYGDALFHPGGHSARRFSTFSRSHRGLSPHTDYYTSSAQFLHFTFQDRHFQFCILPFSLSPSPWLFTKIMLGFIAHLEAISLSIQTISSSALTQLCKLHQVLQGLQSHGFLVNHTKANCLSLRFLQHPRTIIDTHKAPGFLSLDRISKLRTTFPQAHSTKSSDLLFLTHLLELTVTSYNILHGPMFTPTRFPGSCSPSRTIKLSILCSGGAPWPISHEILPCRVLSNNYNTEKAELKACG